MFPTRLECIFIRTSSAAADKPEVVEDGHTGGRQGTVVSHIGRRVLVVTGLDDYDSTVGHFVQDNHFKRYGQRFVRPPVSRQNGTEHGRAARGHHLLAVDRSDVFQYARHVLLVHRIDVLHK